MDEPLCVNCRQGTEYGNHHIKGFLYADCSACICNVGFKGNALNIVHDKIGRAVLVKIIRHSGNPRLPHEFRQSPGLLLKPFPAIGKFLLLALHGHGNGVPHAGADVVRHILLHRHTGIQL